MKRFLLMTTNLLAAVSLLFAGCGGPSKAKTAPPKPAVEDGTKVPEPEGGDKADDGDAAKEDDAKEDGADDNAEPDASSADDDSAGDDSAGDDADDDSGADGDDDDDDSE